MRRLATVLFLLAATCALSAQGALASEPSVSPDSEACETQPPPCECNPPKPWGYTCVKYSTDPDYWADYATFPLSPNPPVPVDPPETYVDEGYPDAEDTATGSDGPEAANAHPLPAADALSASGVDMANVTIINKYTAVMAANAMSYTQCPRLYMCLWQNAGFRGRSMAIAVYQAGYNTTINLRDYGLSDEVSSWRNRRSLISFGYVDADRHGRAVCFRRFSNNPRMYYLNDQISSMDLRTAGFCTS